MSPTLRRYVVRLYLGTAALALLAVLLIFLLIDFGDRLKLYAGKPPAAVAELYLCKAAVMVGQLLPAALLLAAGLALTVLKRRGELDALRALGVSPARVVGVMLWCAVPLSAGSVAFDERVAGPAGARVDALMVQTFGVWGDYRYFYGSQRWLRLGPDVFRLSAQGATVFRLGPGFDLDQRIDAAEVRPAGEGTLELVDERVRDYREGAPQHLRTAPLEVARFPLADPRAFAIRPGRPEQMSLPELVEQERLRALAGLPVVRHSLARHGRLSYPFLGAVGALLAAALALRPGRRAQLTVALVEGLLVSAAMWGLLVVARALALSDRLPPAAAAWGPLLALGLLGAALLRRAEKSS